MSINFKILCVAHYKDFLVESKLINDKQIINNVNKNNIDALITPC